MFQAGCDVVVTVWQHISCWVGFFSIARFRVFPASCAPAICYFTSFCRTRYRNKHASMHTALLGTLCRRTPFGVCTYVFVPVAYFSRMNTEVLTKNLYFEASSNSRQGVKPRLDDVCVYVSLLYAHCVCRHFPFLVSGQAVLQSPASIGCGEKMKHR